MHMLSVLVSLTTQSQRFQQMVMAQNRPQLLFISISLTMRRATS